MEETQISVGYPDEELPMFRVREGNTVYNVHSFVYRLKSADVKLNAENTEFRWVAPAEVDISECVDGIDFILKQL